MGFFDKIFGSLNKETEGGNADLGVIPEKMAVFPEWFFTARIGQPRRININEVRKFGKSPWVQMVLNTIKKEIDIIEWDIVNADDDDDTDNSDKIKEVKKFLKDINSEHESINDIYNQIVTDVGEIDAGVWVKVYSPDSYEFKEIPVMDDLGNIKGTEYGLKLKPFGQRKLVQVRPADASTFLKQIDVYRRLQAYYQYSFKNPRTNPIRFEPDEILYFQMNQRSYSLYGFSPLQAIQQVLETLIQSTRWNKEYFKNNAIPDGIIGLPEANKESMKEFKRMWNQEVKGKPHKLLYHNTNANFTSFMTNARDMEWLNGQKWYFHLVFGVYGLSPVEAGFHENVNQGNQAGQERVTVKNAIKPYLVIAERKINNLITEYLQDENHGLKFVYKPSDHAEEQIEHENHMKEIEIGALTINEYRKKKGLDPVKWGDTPSLVPDANYGQMPTFNEQEQDKPSKDDSKDNNNMEDKMIPYTKAFEIDAGNDIVEESEDYADFYMKQVNLWQRKVLSALDDVPIEKMYHAETIKTFGEFLQKMFNSINTTKFLGKLRIYIKRGLIKGMESAEQELNMDIGFTQLFDKRVKALEHQQLEGYTLPDGKKWYGIKGASNELRLNILKSVQDDVINKRSRNEMAENIKDIFEGSTTSQAYRIARTESNRFISEGKLTGYIESGIEGKKVYLSVGDSRVSEICKRLNSKYGEKGIGFDEEFIDEKTGKSFMIPPSHTNCRCTIGYRKP